MTIFRVGETTSPALSGDFSKHTGPDAAEKTKVDFDEYDDNEDGDDGKEVVEDEDDDDDDFGDDFEDFGEGDEEGDGDDFGDFDDEFQQADMGTGDVPMPIQPAVSAPSFVSCSSSKFPRSLLTYSAAACPRP